MLDREYGKTIEKGELGIKKIEKDFEEIIRSIHRNKFEFR